jgi:hypothetical protein
MYLEHSVPISAAVRDPVLLHHRLEG